MLALGLSCLMTKTGYADSGQVEAKVNRMRRHTFILTADTREADEESARETET